jgi:ABC-type antimicrobial peptide transport system permease subunit
MAEAVLICLLGAAGGVCLALLVAPVLNAQLGGVIGAFELRWIDALSALGLAALMGICIALPSARAAQNLPIVDALREVG